jgi:hypothetical protein
VGVFALALAGGSAATGSEDPDFWANKEVTVPASGDVDRLSELGYDLGESVQKNDDGTITIQVIGTDTEFAAISDLGYTIGTTIEDQNTWDQRIAEREAAIAAENRAQSLAEHNGPTAFSRLNGFDPTSKITIQRVDYFTNYAGRFMSVEAFNTDTNGTGTTGPTLAMSWKEAGGSYGTSVNMSRYNDTDPTPDVYLYHRITVRIGALGSTSPVPATVKVAASTGAISEAPVNVWNGANLPPMAAGYLANFWTHYADPTEGKAKINALAAEFPNIAEIVDLPNDTNGYRRKAMAILNGTGAIGTAPATAAQGAAVVLFSKAYDDNAIQVEILNPGTAGSPLSVSVLGKRITVRLATGATGALSSTAAQIVAALNASPDASALVTAYTWAGNAGAGITAARALVNLSDFLNAPASVARAPFHMQALRIGKHRDGSKVGFSMVCEEHAREWVTPNVCLETAERLVRNYATDPTTRELVDNLDIFIIPAGNPDGSHYSFYDFGSQRRNMFQYCPFTATTGMPSARNAWGVDNNRNFSVGSLFDGFFGASTGCNSDTYAGPFELSEPENRNEDYIPETHPNIKFSMNVHSSGGLFMWSPAAYKNDGLRTPLPYPNIGIEGYFWDTAARVLDRIKQWRGTVIDPEQTGPVIDVLYSAAGNQSDEMYYKYGIIAYDFEVGANRFTSTTTGTGSSGVGFMPAFNPEGTGEANEFASGNFGLLEQALTYSRDVEPPIANVFPNGQVSQSAIKATFSWANEPSVIYYTTDGSTPTLASTQWQSQGPRRPGQVFRFDEPKTTLKWIAKDMKGNVSDPRSAIFYVDTTAASSSASVAPPAHNGWYGAPFVTLSGDDGDVGSGVDFLEYKVDGAADWTRYASPFAVVGDGDHTVEFRSTDKAGNIESSKTLAFRIDATKPTISLTVPAAAASYALASVHDADYACDDALSGVASCVGTVPDGDPINTASVGTKTFKVDAEDVAGNTANLTRTYEVIWNRYAGFFQPVDNGSVNVAQPGSAIPVKFTLGGNYGLSIFAAGYPASQQVGCSSSLPSDAIEETVTPGASTLTFSDGQYHYVWKTQSAWAGTCRQLIVKLRDNTVHTALFRFRG